MALDLWRVVPLQPREIVQQLRRAAGSGRNRGALHRVEGIDLILWCLHRDVVVDAVLWIQPLIRRYLAAGR